LDCVVYLYSSSEDADLGINIGGSGFVMRIPSENPKLIDLTHHLYAVTNRHVIEGGFPCVRFNARDGGRLVVDAKPDDWFISDRDDLAVAPMPDISAKLKANTLPVEDLLTKDEVSKYGIGVGDDVVMLGRFINREGLQQNSPTARFGHIAQMPGDPIEVAIKGKTLSQEDAFLCEVRSIGGYSGSPVILLPNPAYGRIGESLPKDRGIVVGVDFCHMRDYQHPLDERGVEMSHMRFPVNTGMAGVVPAWKLRELIMSDRALKQRRGAEEATLKRLAAAD